MFKKAIVLLCSTSNSNIIHSFLDTNILRVVGWNLLKLCGCVTKPFRVSRLSGWHFFPVNPLSAIAACQKAFAADVRVWILEKFYFPHELCSIIHGQVIIFSCLWLSVTDPSSHYFCHNVKTVQIHQGNKFQVGITNIHCWVWRLIDFYNGLIAST